MDVVLQLHRDNRITVTERLQVEMLDGTSHCIYRSLRVAARPPVRKAEAPLLKVLEASIDGVPCRTDDLKARFGTQNVGVYLRDGKRQLAPGIHAFTLVYEMTDVIGLDGGGQGLHLPARGRLRLFPCALPLPVAVLWGRDPKPGPGGRPSSRRPAFPVALPAGRARPLRRAFRQRRCTTLSTTASWRAQALRPSSSRWPPRAAAGFPAMPRRATASSASSLRQARTRSP